MGNNVILTHQHENENGGDFNKLLKDFETAYAMGNYGNELMALSTAIAYSVLNKLLDPNRTTAGTPRKDGTMRDVSNNGNNPVLLDVKRGLSHDLRTLAETAYTVENATRLEYNRETDEWQETTDNKSAAGYVQKIMSATLSDGLDVVNEVAMCILSLAQEHATEAHWMTKKYVVRRLDKRTYIRLSDSAAYRDEETTPMQEVHRHVCGYIRSTQSAKVDTGKYLYIDGEDSETLERVYYRLGKYTDLGTDTAYGYTASEQTALDMTSAVESLNLTARQAEVLALRMGGYGYKAIATYLGVTQRAIAKTCEGIQKKAISAGLVSADNVGRFADRPERAPSDEPRTAPTARTVNHWEEVESLYKTFHD